ncbi:MAG: hypothetical protein IRZ31_07660 [Thermogemmatispora sp.]|uniref:hypothetical protein n=1 Tax=Thermogemmatispora sp. TaxID=1968838 RepID=UPI0026293AC9|nr:hypothetical protein [Thermogemmatispora sp.]MBX5456763.1 hypothetical protein [Thermogemmatispora sp.]
MSFTARDLRYEPEKSFPALEAFLRQRAQRYLGPLQYDAEEVDLVVNHVVERLVTLGLLGGGDRQPETVLDRLSEPQFYAFLNNCVRHKAIDRLRRQHRQMLPFSALQESEEYQGEADPLGEVTTPLWGVAPFAHPEEAALAAVTQQELRILLKHCIKALASAPRQLRAVLQELETVGAVDLAREVVEELQAISITLLPAETPLAHLSQHRDHAYKKLRACLQSLSSNLAVVVALRLTEYEALLSSRSNEASGEIAISIQDLVSQGLTLAEVKQGLRQLTFEGLLNWHEGDEVVHLDAARLRRLARYYRVE